MKVFATAVIVFSIAVLVNGIFNSHKEDDPEEDDIHGAGGAA